MCCLLLSAERKRAFIKRRKMHYNEFQAVKLARQLIENEDDDDDDDASFSQSQQLETTSSEATDNVQHSGDTEDKHMSTEDVV